MPAEPVCLACRRPLAPEPEGVVLTFEMVAAAEAAMAEPRPATREELDALVEHYTRLSLCRACGRPL